MRKVWVTLGLVALLAAFLAGLLPQWSARRAAQRDAAEARAALEDAQRQLRTCRLHNRLVDVVMAAQAHNFGIAAEQAQRFLDDIQALSATAGPEARVILERVRPRAKEMAEAAQRLDPQVPADLNRIASETTSLLGELEKATPAATATPR